MPLLRSIQLSEHALHDTIAFYQDARAAVDCLVLKPVLFDV